MDQVNEAKHLQRSGNQNQDKMAVEFVQEALEKCRVLRDKIWHCATSSEEKSIRIYLSDALFSSAIAGITFPVFLGCLQTGIFRPLRISSNLLFAPVCGCISVFISGGCASLLLLSSFSFIGKNDWHKTLLDKRQGYVHVPNEYSLAISVRPADIPLCGFGSLIVFRILGGRFRSVLPSSLIHPGAFARKYIPAKGQNYASATVRRRLRLLGREYGCHSCGRRWWTSFVGDHIPPNKLVREGQQQRFYPQCTHCSYLQGAALSSMSRLQRIKTHGTSLRLYHLWLPLPLPLAVLRNYINENSGAKELDENSVSKEADEDSTSKEANEDSVTKEVNKGSDIADEIQDGYLHTILNGVLILLKIKKKDDSEDYD